MKDVLSVLLKYDVSNQSTPEGGSKRFMEYDVGPLLKEKNSDDCNVW